eukprot:TRINITY_DN5609_c0_g2_i1.p1 TRINITY_DN5609_c0_g2~~TRINITY_DN5609_c0_g2_i1.p1  ORF type:complete len:697 (+),score=198.37 TRINITY_DN5609_c0_g2_i1:115-2205(+)
MSLRTSNAVHPTLLGSERMQDAAGNDKQLKPKLEDEADEDGSPTAADDDNDRLGPRVRFAVRNTFVELEEEERPTRRQAFRRAQTAPVGSGSTPSESEGEGEEEDMVKSKSEPHQQHRQASSEEPCVVQEEVRCFVKNTFVEVEDDESADLRRKALRRMHTDPPLQGNAAEQADDNGDGIDFEDEACAEADAVSGLSTSASVANAEGQQEPDAADSASAVPAQAAQPKELSAPTSRLRFAVKNTFVEVLDDASDDDDSDQPPGVRRAVTDPIAIKCLNGAFDNDAEDLSRQASGKSDPPVEEEERGGAAAETEDVLGNVWKLSQETDGCWTVQRALEKAEGEEERLKIASELAGHVWEALQHPHANFVLQKCITTLHPQSVQFIIDEIIESGSASLAARSRCGCRVVQRLLEYCSRAQTAALSEDLLSRAMPTCQHRFGRYVMQCLVEHGSRHHVRRLADILSQRIAAACLDDNACSVVARLLAPNATPRAERELLAASILRAPGLGTQMRRSRLGSAVVRLAAQVTSEPGSGDSTFVAPQPSPLMQVVAPMVVAAAAQGVEGAVFLQPSVAAAIASANLAGANAADAAAAAAASSGVLAPAAPGGSRHRRRGAGGGDVAQATAEARDILESLRAACGRRNPHRITKAVRRLELAAMAPGAAPLLLAEAPLACLTARGLLQQLALENAEDRHYGRR